MGQVARTRTRQGHARSDPRHAAALSRRHRGLLPQALAVGSEQVTVPFVSGTTNRLRSLGGRSRFLSQTQSEIRNCPSSFVSDGTQIFSPEVPHALSSRYAGSPSLLLR